MQIAVIKQIMITFRCTCTQSLQVTFQFTTNYVASSLNHTDCNQSTMSDADELKKDDDQGNVPTIHTKLVFLFIQITVVTILN